MHTEKKKILTSVVLCCCLVPGFFTVTSCNVQGKCLLEHVLQQSHLQCGMEQNKIYTLNLWSSISFQITLPSQLNCWHWDVKLRRVFSETTSPKSINIQLKPVNCSPSAIPMPMPTYGYDIKRLLHHTEFPLHTETAEAWSEGVDRSGLWLKSFESVNLC